jgi:hypothetical protein
MYISNLVGLYMCEYYGSYVGHRVARFYKPKWEKYTKMATKMTNDSKSTKRDTKLS